ncbi:MAG: hypothetical protein GXO87_09020 [Chlorobi bacterium]|nr:hypothetical protein [Chlorobiota bacterium]
MKKNLFLIVVFFITIQPLLGQSLTCSPVAGNVTSNGADIVFRTDGARQVKIEFSLTNDFSQSQFTNEITTGSDNQEFFGKISLTNLLPDAVYYYRFIVDGQLFSDGIERSLKTFPVDGDETDFKFIFGSGQQERNDPESYVGNIFPLLADEEAAFFIHQGDWTYPDTTDYNNPGNYFNLHYDLIVDSYRSKYALDYPMRYLLANTPVAYTFDDHDLSNNDCDGTYPGIPNSIKGYVNLFPSYPLVDSSDGVYQKFTYGNSDIFLLDNRSERSPNIEAFKYEGDSLYFDPLDGHTILGDAQMTWLLNELKNSTADWKFLSTGTPFNPGWRAAIEWAVSAQGFIDSLLLPTTGYVTPEEIALFAADKWSAFPEDIIRLIKFISDNQIKNVIFLSGDTHTTGVDNGANSIFPELMASGLDRTNGRTVQIFEYLGIHVWNSGGHTYDLPMSKFGNSFGRVFVFGKDSVRLEAVTEENEVIGSTTVLNGYLPQRKSLAVGPDYLYFGDVEIGNKLSFNSNIISTSCDSVTLLSSEIVGSENFSAEFERDFPLIIKAGEKTAVKLTYAPSEAGNDTVRLLIATDAPNHLQLEITAVGSGKKPDGIFTGDENIEGFKLGQNFPNPFGKILGNGRTSTVIAFTLPQAGNVELIVFNSIGEKVKTLVKGYGAGNYEAFWNGKDEYGSELPSGVYIYQIRFGAAQTAKKIVLIR